MRAYQHESVRHASANHEGVKYGKPNIHNIAQNLMLEAIFVPLIKSSTSLLLLLILLLLIMMIMIIIKL